MIKAQVADLVSGGRTQTLPATRITWERRILSPESLSVSMTRAPRAQQRLDIRNLTSEVKSALVISDDDYVIGAGPIWGREYDDATGRWSCDAEGIWSLLEHWHVLPPDVTAQNLLVASGENEGEPNPAVRTSFTAKTWPQIVRGLLEQSMSRSGGNIPLSFGPAGVGSHDKEYESSAFKTVGEALSDLTKLVDGPEIAFTPRIVNGAIEWLVEVGDDAKRELSTPVPHLFDFSAPKRPVRKFRVRSSGKDMASEVWGLGGRQAAKALFSRAASSKLIEAGYPRLESTSSAHATVVRQDTLDKYTEADLRGASAPTEWWSWEMHADRTPRLADVRVGDYCTVRIRGNRYLPDSPPEGYPRRIVALSGDSRSRWVKVTTDEVVTW